MNKEEEKKDLETEIKDDAVESEKKDKEEDKDYETDKSKDTTDREKFMKQDAERAEQDSREEDKDYAKLDSIEEDKRYDNHEARISALEKKLNDYMKPKEEEPDRYKDFRIDLDK